MRFDDDFFKTETRDGFEVPPMMKRAWAAQMEVLKVVTDICDRNEIKYSAEFGTRLGAVRHKGMIPWDDDIDISLMREDYNRLLKILHKELPQGFVVAGMYADCERLQEAAFVLQSRVIADEELWDFNDYMKYFHGFPYQRVGIDIYPIDYISRDKEFAETQREIIQLGLMILRQWNELNRNGCLKQCIAEFGKLCNVDIALDSETRNYIWKLIDKVCAMCYEEEADYAAYYDGWINNDNYRMHKECFKDVFKAKDFSFRSASVER